MSEQHKGCNPANPANPISADHERTGLEHLLDELNRLIQYMAKSGAADSWLLVGSYEEDVSLTREELEQLRDVLARLFPEEAPTDAEPG